MSGHVSLARCYRCGDRATKWVDCVEHRFRAYLCDDHTAETMEYFTSVDAMVRLETLNIGDGSDAPETVEAA